MLNSMYAVHKKVANTNKVLGIFKEGGRGDDGGGGGGGGEIEGRNVGQNTRGMPQC